LLRPPKSLPQVGELLLQITRLLHGVARLRVFESALLQLSEHGCSGAQRRLGGLHLSLRMYTTTYSVLEYYYLVMLTASDTKVQNEDAAMAKRDALALKTDAAMRQFEPWRVRARNSLWGSVILILAAGAMQTIEERGVREWSTIVVIVILFTGAMLIPVTVQKFRHTFRPLLGLYRDADWAGAAGKGKGQVHPNDSVGA